jgi:hypothetical protein
VSGHDIAVILGVIVAGVTVVACCLCHCFCFRILVPDGFLFLVFLLLMVFLVLLEFLLFLLNMQLLARCCYC